MALDSHELNEEARSTLKKALLEKGSLKTAISALTQIIGSDEDNVSRSLRRILSLRDSAKKRNLTFEWRKALEEYLGKDQIARILRTSKASQAPRERAERTQEIANRLCYDQKYISWVPPDKKAASEIATFLGERYGVSDKLFRFRDTILASAILWKTTANVNPDQVLGTLDTTHPAHTCPEEEREFLTKQEEEKAEKLKKEGKIWRTDEGVDYCMTQVLIKKGALRIQGATCFYFDHVLSQTSLPWELAKAFLEGNLSDSNLPRRRQFEETTPKETLYRATRRCAGMAVNTLTVIRAKNGSLNCILPKRSDTVLQSPRTWDVCPSAMFECATKSDLSGEWSIKLTVAREFAEEILHQKELVSPDMGFAGQIASHENVRWLLDLIDRRKAILSITGLSISLPSLVPDICTILVVDEKDLPLKHVSFNIEYERIGAIRAFTPKILDEFFDQAGASVKLAAAPTLELGYRWFEKNVRF